METITLQLEAYSKPGSSVPFSFKRNWTMKELLDQASDLLGFDVVAFYNEEDNRLTDALDFPKGGKIFASKTAYPFNTEKRIKEKSRLDKLNKYTQFQVAVLGAPGVGKSALVLRFISDTFTDSYRTTVQSSASKHLEFKGRKYDIKVLDTAGQEDFHPLHSRWISSKDAFMLALSIENLELKEALNYNKLIRTMYHDPIIILVITKLDLLDDITDKVTKLQSLAAVKNTAQQNNWLYIETSSKTGLNVQRSFEEIIDAKYSASKVKAVDSKPDKSVSNERATIAQSWFSTMWKKICCR